MLWRLGHCGERTLLGNFSTAFAIIHLGLHSAARKRQTGETDCLAFTGPRNVRVEDGTLSRRFARYLLFAVDLAIRCRPEFRNHADSPYEEVLHAGVTDALVDISGIYKLQRSSRESEVKVWSICRLMLSYLAEYQSRLLRAVPAFCEVLALILSGIALTFTPIATSRSSQNRGQLKTS